MSAKIGILDCCKGAFVNYKKRAIVASNMTVDNGVIFVDSSFKGEINMNASRIGSHLDFRGSKFDGEVHVSVAEIKNIMVLQKIKGKGVFNFVSTKAYAYADDKDSRERFNFYLDGFTYHHFINPGDVKSRIKKWLGERPKGIRFSPQPFEQAAKVLFEMGRGSDARMVLFEAEKAATDNYVPKNLWQWLFYPVWWLWRQLLRITTGYNYLPGQMFLTSIVIVALGAWIFCEANERGYIVPHQPVVLANMDYKAHAKDAKKQADDMCRSQRPTEITECVFPGYPPFNAVLFSMDVFIPTSPLHQEAYWYPQLDANTPDDWRRLLTVWYVIEIIAGWLLVSLITLTYTGILQRRQVGGSGK